MEREFDCLQIDFVSCAISFLRSVETHDFIFIFSMICLTKWFYGVWTIILWYPISLFSAAPWRSSLVKSVELLPEKALWEKFNCVVGVFSAWKYKCYCLPTQRLNAVPLAIRKSSWVASSSPASDDHLEQVNSLVVLEQVNSPVVLVVDNSTY